MTLNVISFSAAISACEKGRQWKQGLSLLSEMRKAGMPPDVISFSATISECVKGRQWVVVAQRDAQGRGDTKCVQL